MLRCLLPALCLLTVACQSPAPVAPPAPAPVLAPPMQAVPPRIGYALGGGGARGFAHVGVLKMLEAQGIVPDVIVGTSAGSVAGALYAAGYSGFDLQEMVFELDQAQITDWQWFGKGVIRGQALQDFINKAVKNQPMEALKRPFACVSARLRTGEAVLFQRGNVGQAVRASSAVPGIFEPALIAGEAYVDGGTVSPVPIRHARRLGADLVIAVDISSPPEAAAEDGTIAIVLKAFDIMGRALREFEAADADVLIRPVLTVASTDFEGKHKAILAGEKAALDAIPAIRAAIAAKTRQVPIPAAPAAPGAASSLPAAARPAR